MISDCCISNIPDMKIASVSGALECLFRQLVLQIVRDLGNSSKVVLDSTVGFVKCHRLGKFFKVVFDSLE